MLDLLSRSKRLITALLPTMTWFACVCPPLFIYFLFLFFWVVAVAVFFLLLLHTLHVLFIV